MRCASCNAENDDRAKACVACGAALKRRRARKRDDDELVSPEAEAHTREAVALYRWSLLALVPVAGLVLGPLVAWRARASRQPGMHRRRVGWKRLAIVFVHQEASRPAPGLQAGPRDETLRSRCAPRVGSDKVRVAT